MNPAGIFTHYSYVVSMRFYKVKDVPKVRDITRKFKSTHTANQLIGGLKMNMVMPLKFQKTRFPYSGLAALLLNLLLEQLVIKKCSFYVLMDLKS